jgi:hypothetical protein
MVVRDAFIAVYMLIECENPAWDDLYPGFF